MLVTLSAAGGKEYDNEPNPERVELLLVLNILRQSQYLNNLIYSTRFGLRIRFCSLTPNKNWGSFIFIHLRWNFEAIKQVYLLLFSQLL